MQKIAVFFFALVLLACAEQKCKVDKDCSPGFKCSGGFCAVNPRCPVLVSPQIPAGCKLETSVDDNYCPKNKVVC
ncbi:hypothetical protein RB195_019718 [Necator americanus]|uniref:Uncharacterized protein n=1 Tax=Necator americanus TaxID=51031 RepID=A0ABR1CFG4_NECAM